MAGAGTFVALVLSIALVTSCADEPTSPGPLPVDGTPPLFNSGSGGDNPDSLPPGTFEIMLPSQSAATGAFSKTQFASYTAKTLVRFLAYGALIKIHLKSGNQTTVSPRGEWAAGGCYAQVVVDFRKPGNLYGGGWAGQCTQPLSTTLVLEGTGTAMRTPGYSWNGFQQCGGAGQPLCFEFTGAHVVQLVPTAQQLELVVDSSSVTSGSTVRFTARRTNGGALTVRSWTWKPLTPVTPPPVVALASLRRPGGALDHATRLSSSGGPTQYGPDATACGLTPTCDVMLTHNDPAVATPQRGYMYVQATVNGVVETARVTVSVNPRAHELAVECSPTTVVRTSAVECTARVTPADPFTVVHLTSVGDGEPIVDEEVFQSFAAGSPATWGGPGVRATTVTISVLAGGTRLSKSASFTIVPRIDRPEFPEWVRKQWPEEPPAPQAAMGPPQLTMAYPGIIVLGDGYQIPQGSVGYTYHLYPFSAGYSRVTAGPNMGVLYVKRLQWVSVGQPSGIYIAASLFPGDPFYERQTGGGDLCGPAEMNQLRQAVIDHENRHYTTFLAQTRPFDIEARFEAMTLLTDLSQPAENYLAPFKLLTDQFDDLVQTGDMFVEQQYPIQPNAPVCQMRP